jgi:hypothetical protein
MNCHKAIDAGPEHLRGICPHRIRVAFDHDP